MEQGLLVQHEESTVAPPDPSIAYKVIIPQMLDRISYHYEWSFDQLKDAALLTLKILKKALAKDFILKDASSFNIQFENSKAIFIDTLSFEPYKENTPWIAYRQFCEHFLAPLALRSFSEDQILPMLNASIEGVGLDLASSLLPTKTKWNPGLQMHLHLHARTTRISDSKIDDEGKTRSEPKAKLPKKKLLAIVESLQNTVKSLKPKFAGFEWSDYYDNTNYVEDAMRAKIDLVKSWTDELNISSAIDLGANTGRFSELIAPGLDHVVAVDQDASSVNVLYKKTKAESSNILSLVIDLSNPSPACGFASEERESFLDRFQSDLSLSLALLHHLAIKNNLPFERVAEFLHTLSEYAIVEWIPKTDSRVQLLLRAREDIFARYDEEHFRSAFATYFDVVKEKEIDTSERKLFLFKRKASSQAL